MSTLYPLRVSPVPNESRLTDGKRDRFARSSATSSRGGVNVNCTNYGLRAGSLSGRKHETLSWRYVISDSRTIASCKPWNSISKCSKTTFVCKSFPSPPIPATRDGPSVSNGATKTNSQTENVKPEPLITPHRIFSILFKEKALIAYSVLALVIGTAASLSLPQFSGMFFETLLGNSKLPLPRLLQFLAVCYCCEVLSTVVYVSSVIRIWERVVSKIKRHVFRSLISQNIAFFDNHGVGELTSLFAVELGNLEKFVSDNATRDRGLRSLSELSLTILILLRTSIELAPAFIFLIIGISLGVGIYKRSTFPAFLSHANAQKRTIECATESFAAIRTVRSFGGERRQFSFFDAEADQCQNSGERLGSLRGLNEGWTRFSVHVSIFCVYILGSAKVQAGTLSPGTVLIFVGYAFTLISATQGLVNTFADLRTMMNSVERINSKFADVTRNGILLPESMDSKVKNLTNLGDEVNTESLRTVTDVHLGDPPCTSEAPISLSKHFDYGGNPCFRGDITLENVCFSYPQRQDVMVLKGLNLSLKSSKVTALVGSSGSGKSTIVQLLSRFYEPTKGSILIDGQNINQFSRKDWSRAVSLVNQDPVLFSSSIKSNISYGLPDEEVSESDVIEAAKLANAHDFITSLPQGYDTFVGDRGGLLSGGQRQRIAIARAILKNSPILILDEATSALDSVSERLVQSALERLMKGRTTLVIAHRLSTVQSAHQIAVMAGGEIVEMDSHSSLLDLGGKYAQLVNSQRLTFE